MAGEWFLAEYLKDHSSFFDIGIQNKGMLINLANYMYLAEIVNTGLE